MTITWYDMSPVDLTSASMLRSPDYKNQNFSLVSETNSHVARPGTRNRRRLRRVTELGRFAVVTPSVPESGTTLPLAMVAALLLVVAAVEIGSLSSAPHGQSLSRVLGARAAASTTTCRSSSITPPESVNMRRATSSPLVQCARSMIKADSTRENIAISKQLSRAVRLLRVAAFASALVPLSSVTAEAIHIPVEHQLQNRNRGMHC